MTVPAKKFDASSLEFLIIKGLKFFMLLRIRKGRFLSKKILPICFQNHPKWSIQKPPPLPLAIKYASAAIGKMTSFHCIVELARIIQLLQFTDSAVALFNCGY